MENNILGIVQAVCTVIAALISAYALIRVNRIDNQDRIRRSLWAFEQYLLATGRCIEEPNKKIWKNTELITYYIKFMRMKNCWKILIQLIVLF